MRVLRLIKMVLEFLGKNSLFYDSEGNVVGVCHIEAHVIKITVV